MVAHLAELQSASGCRKHPNVYSAAPPSYNGGIASNTHASASTCKSPCSQEGQGILMQAVHRQRLATTPGAEEAPEASLNNRLRRRWERVDSVPPHRRRGGQSSPAGRRGCSATLEEGGFVCIDVRLQRGGEPMLLKGRNQFTHQWCHHFVLPL
mmetsp:Transcript_72380/g.121490  ORF Transcript_72380/g.121490 Transcript_72380/m.121490 type:complete len:154 (+) Transcript_72380:179-640(+)